MIEPRASTGRLDERLVLRIGLILAAGFVVAAIVAYAIPVLNQGHWAGLHLALAGAALVAVGTFMPHFGVTLAGSVPEAARLRLGGVGSLASGAALVVIGVTARLPVIAVIGAGLLWLGVAITGWTTVRPGRRPLARRHPIAQSAYLVALADVSIGIGLPVLLLAGWEPAVAGWVRLKPAHVWLNLFGFVSLTIGATLVYLYPTVVGARIRLHPSLAPMIVGGMLGPPLVALGAVAGLAAVATIGAAVAVMAAAGQVLYVADAWIRRGRWTTDAGWHALTIGHFSIGAGWYLLAVVVAAVGIVRDGPTPDGWTIGALAMPLMAGWALQVLVGAWTHLLPAVATTDPARRARQRSILGTAALPRLVAWNFGVLFGWVGLAANVLPVALVGAGLVAVAAVSAVSLLLRALVDTTMGNPAVRLPHAGPREDQRSPGS